MQKLFLIISFLCLLSFFSSAVFAQDSTIIKHDSIANIKNDSLLKAEGIKDHSPKNALASDTFLSKQFNPRIATIRSAILPGWGQMYNKQYWKLPLVYGALGTTAGIFFYNINIYNQLRKAYSIRLSGDTASFNEINVEFRALSTETIRADRDIFRQNIDYSVLVFLIFWGVNVVDATVAAHLKGFDVGNNLSLQIKPGYSPFANTNGISIVLNLDRKHM
jgi:hypothetical protein